MYESTEGIPSLAALDVASPLPNPLYGARCAIPASARVDPDDRGQLLWLLARSEEGFVSWPDGEPTRGALNAFLKLPTRGAEDVATFARSYGVLGICEHGVPGIHRACDPVRRYPLFLEVGADKAADWMTEPIAAWQLWAGRLTAALNLADDLRAGLEGDEDDWITILPGDASIWREVLPHRSRPWATAQLGAIVTGWLTMAGVAPALVWIDRPGPALTLALGGFAAPALASRDAGFVWPANSLFPVLVTELALAIAAGPIGHCSVCKTPFTTDNDARSVRRDRRAFCSADCRLDARRAAKKEWARRRRRAQRPRNDRRGPDDSMPAPA